jgi:hypothetical protein
MFDSTGLKPSVIRFEHLNLSRQERQDCFAFLGARGYRMFRDDIDTIAYRPALVGGPSHSPARLPDHRSASDHREVATLPFQDSSS